MGVSLPVTFRSKTRPNTMQYAEIAKATAAVLIVFIVPILTGTLVFRRVRFARGTAVAWSMAANSAALVAISLLLRITGIGVFRESFLAMWLAWIAARLFVRTGSIGLEEESDKREDPCFGQHPAVIVVNRYFVWHCQRIDVPGQ